jgi:hypothetical protein
VCGVSDAAPPAPAARACWPFLFQGRDLLQFLLRPGLLPISKELLPMESGPFNHESQGARRQLAGEDGLVLNSG